MPNYNFGMGFQSNPMDAYGEMAGIVRRSRLSKLLGDYYSTGQADIGQLAQLDPETAASVRQEQQKASLGKMLGEAYTADEGKRKQILAQVYALDPSIGMQAARMFDPASTGDGTPSDIRSLQMLQANPELLKLDRERRQAGGMVPKLIQTEQGYGWGTPGGGIQLAPLNGVAGQQPTQQDMQADIELANQMASAGIDPDKIDAFIASRGQRAEAGAIAQPRDREITPYQKAQIELQRERLAAAQQARDQATAARKSADEIKASQQAQAANARQAEAASSAQSLIDSIDSLTKSPGFSDLGTWQGDAKINVPMIRNDAKDANAQLKNIAGQVALATMSRLKTLSAQGATGFGALSQQELRLLENSISTLQSENISNAQLRKSLKTIRDAMTKTVQWRGGGEKSPAPQGGGWKIEVVD